MSKSKLTTNQGSFQDFSFSDMISYILNLLAAAERNIYLQQHPEDKGNGFYNRNLSSGSLSFQLDVPRTRSNSFRPFFLPEKWQRHQKQDYIKLAESVLLASKSVEAAKRGLRQLSLPITEDYLEEVAAELREYFDIINSSSLDPDLFALIVDAKSVKVKTKSFTSNYTTYTAVGISLEGKKDILACYTADGKETLDGWKQFLKSLITRGLRRVLIVIHDDFPGTSNLISSLFPQADNQVCSVHMMRNLKYCLSKRQYRMVKQKFQTIKHTHSFELAGELFQQICDEISEEDPNTAQRLLAKKDNYLVFLKYPFEVRSSISSTNLAEAFNRKIEDAQQLSGGYFHSIDDLKLKLGISIRELHRGRWRKPFYKIASASHILMAEFKRRFENDLLQLQTQFS